MNQPHHPTHRKPAGLPIDRGAAIGLAAGTSMRLRVTVDGHDIAPLLTLHPERTSTAAGRARYDRTSTIASP